MTLPDAPTAHRPGVVVVEQTAETEKNNLEGAKMEAEALLTAERDVLQKKWLLHHVRLHTRTPLRYTHIHTHATLNPTHNHSLSNTHAQLIVHTLNS